ncbi:MAG: hypothetical protein GY754_23870 [bacterium]|nr:hypothetical protein [bacterium]
MTYTSTTTGQRLAGRSGWESGGNGDRVIGIIFLVLVLFLAQCGSTTVVYNGFNIDKGFHISKSIRFIKQHDPASYTFLKMFVKEIRFSTYYYTRSYPFYDTIYMAGYALDRGAAYGASVIVHELYHIIFQQVRNKKGKLAPEVRNFLESGGVDYQAILNMNKKKEEKIVHVLQLKFLQKYGPKADIKYQELRIKRLD